MYVVTECIQEIYIYIIPGTINDLKGAVEAAKHGIMVGEDTGRYGVGTDVCRLLCGDIRNTRRIAENYREGATIN